MLEIMRSHKFFSVFLLSVITGVIIVTFVFWGIGTQNQQVNSVLAEVEKEKITQEEYWRVFDNAERYYREQNKTEEEMKKLNLKDKVLNDLIDSKVLMIAANNMKIKVTEDELQQEIMNNPSFQKNGVFDKNVYLRTLELNRTTPAAYESSMMKELTLKKMQMLIGETAELSQDEIKVLEALQGEKTQLANAFLSIKRELLTKAYVEGLKRQMNIKINKDMIN
ncbi:MAG: SurA N-terminal domain-containing protein [Nitrospirae bacterium]|nr:SurA N-terminal domain-containing protein [Nitrospirota bacterium]